MAKLTQAVKGMKNRKLSVERVKSMAVCVDYPQADETIGLLGYAVRIAAPAEVRVEVAIDGGDWLSCREAEGYFWFDWSGYPAGDHEVCARITLADGRPKVSGKRRFKAGS